VVTSRDGRVRVWTTDLERAGESGAVTRGQAWLQWTSPDGALHAVRAPLDLHLDTVVDAVEPLPGHPGRYLLLGLRAYATTYPGDTPRRFALVLDLRGPSAERVTGAFVVGGARRDALLLSAPEPSTGKFRHHAFATRWMRFDADALRLESVPGSPGAVQPPAVVARLRDGRFQVEPGPWDDVTLADGWAPGTP
jgi:hypothetical protein